MTIRHLQFGEKGIIRLTGTDEDFVNGYQAGSLTYARSASTHQQTDATITSLLVQTMDSIGQSDRYSAGFVLGWLNSLGEKGIKEATDAPVPLLGTAVPEQQAPEKQEGEGHES